MTRSVTSAAHGDLKASISFHAFGPFVLVVGLITWGLLGVGLVRGKNLIPDIDTPFWTYSIVGWFVLLILYWIARVLTHTTP